MYHSVWQRFSSQDRENSIKKNSFFPPLSYSREDCQLPLSKSSTSLTQRWKSTPLPDSKCKFSLGLIFTDTNLSNYFNKFVWFRSSGVELMSWQVDRLSFLTAFIYLLWLKILIILAFLFRSSWRRTWSPPWNDRKLNKQVWKYIGLSSQWYSATKQWNEASFFGWWALQSLKLKSKIRIDTIYLVVLLLKKHFLHWKPDIFVSRVGLRCRKCFTWISILS